MDPGIQGSFQATQEEIVHSDNPLMSAGRWMTALVVQEEVEVETEAEAEVEVKAEVEVEVEVDAAIGWRVALRALAAWMSSDQRNAL
jgi:hypothetical protein